MPAPAESAVALVLRTVDYGEADRIVTLLTREHGRVSALARSARKSKRRFAGALEGFAWLSVELGFGKGGLAQLVSARVTRSFPHLLSDLARLEGAGVLLRLARDLVPERVPDADLYDALADMLVSLDQKVLPTKPLQLAAQLHLLQLTGFAPMLSACAVCGKVPGEGRPALFDPARGGLICRSCGGGPDRLSFTVRTRLLRALEDMEGVLEVALEPWTADELRGSERALSSFINHVLARST